MSNNFFGAYVLCSGFSTMVACSEHSYYVPLACLKMMLVNMLCSLLDSLDKIHVLGHARNIDHSWC